MDPTEIYKTAVVKNQTQKSVNKSTSTQSKNPSVEMNKKRTSTKSKVNNSQPTKEINNRNIIKEKKPNVSQVKKESKKKSMKVEIQDKILGKRDNDITGIETRNFMREDINPEFNFVLKKGLEDNALDPSLTILQAISYANDYKILIPIGLCLRYGADPNMYVNAPKLGKIHVLGYVYSNLYKGSNPKINKSVVDSIILMFLLAGARKSMPIYDEKAGKIKDINYNYGNNTSSVSEWVELQGYDTFLNKIVGNNIENLNDLVDKDSINILSILLDDDRITIDNYTSLQKRMVVEALCEKKLENFKISDDKDLLDNLFLKESVLYINSLAFKKGVETGYIPSYPLINQIVVLMRKYKNSQDIVIMQEYQKMLIESIKYGAQLDQDQLSIISVVGSDVLQSIMKEYERPFWKKSCQFLDNAPDNVDNVNINDPLKKLAISLNINPHLNKKSICEKLTNLSKTDPDVVKTASKSRQEARMISEMATVDEYANNNKPKLSCRNKSLLKNDPNDYNDLEIAYFRDDQGAIWCIPSDMFASIIESGKNPYNETLFPSTFIDYITYKSNVLKKMGVAVDLGEMGIYSSKIPMSFSEAIDSLTVKDKISEKTSEEALNKFRQLASENNISPATINSLSKLKMKQALRSINIDVDLTPLSISHSLITTARIITELDKSYPDLVSRFFSSLNDGSF